MEAITFANQHQDEIINYKFKKVNNEGMMEETTFEVFIKIIIFRMLSDFYAMKIHYKVHLINLWEKIKDNL